MSMLHLVAENTTPSEGKANYLKFHPRHGYILGGAGGSDNPRYISLYRYDEDQKSLSRIHQGPSQSTTESYATVYFDIHPSGRFVMSAYRSTYGQHFIVDVDSPSIVSNSLGFATGINNRQYSYHPSGLFVLRSYSSQTYLEAVNPTTGTKVGTVQTFSNSNYGTAFSPNGRYVLRVHNHTAYIHAFKDETIQSPVLASITTPSIDSYQVIWTPQGFYRNKLGASLYQFDGEVINSIEFPENIRAVHPSAPYAVTQTGIYRFDQESPVLEEELISEVRSADFSPDGHMLVVSYMDNTMRLYYFVPEPALIFRSDGDDLLYIVGNQIRLGISDKEIVTPVSVTNLTETTATNVTITAQNLFASDVVELSKTLEPFVPEPSLVFPSLEVGQRANFYIRVKPGVGEAMIRKLKLIASADFV